MSSISLHRDGAVAELVIDRADKRNALSLEMWESIAERAAEAEADDDVRVLLVRGDGPHFSAGADIGEFRERRSTPEAATHYTEQLEATTGALTGMTKPSIAVVRGYCIGGGCELALSCDLRLADTTAQFAITPAKLGIVYNFGSTHRLVATTGPSFAKYLLLSGERVDAEEALRVRLIDRLVASEDLDDAARGLAGVIAGRSQTSVRGGKRLVEKVVAGVDDADDEARRIPIDAVSSADYREGVAAFLEKRAPDFGPR